MKKIKVLAVLLILVLSINISCAALTPAENFLPQNVQDYLISQIEAGKTQISLEKFKIEEKIFHKQFEQFLFDNQHLAYFPKDYSYKYYAGGIITSITVKYNEVPRYYLKETVIPEFIKLARESITATSQTEIVKQINKYICDYLTYALPETNLYYAILNKTGNCEDYSGLFTLLCKEFGIEVQTEHNSDHIWNQVKIDDTWLLVDVTWNDDSRSIEDYLLIPEDQHYVIPYEIIQEELVPQIEIWDWEPEPLEPVPPIEWFAEQAGLPADHDKPNDERPLNWFLYE